LPLNGEWNAYCQSVSGYMNGAPLDLLSIADFLAYGDASTDSNWRVREGYGNLIAANLPDVPLRLSSCVAAALWPERVGCLVSYAGYDIIDLTGQRHPTPPALEKVFWYQHLFQTERGRGCLSQHRQDLCRILWSEWSPGWLFDDHTFARSANAFENPDIVDVVISCYRRSFGLEAGEAALQEFEAQLAQKHRITVPTITIDGSNDPLKPGGTSDHAKMFVGFHEHRVADAGHNVPQEQPEDFADAVINIHKQMT